MKNNGSDKYMAKQRGAKAESKKIECQECHRELIETNFYISKSPLFPSGRVGVCKTCIKKKLLENEGDKNILYSIFQALDIPFFYDKWEETYLQNNEDLIATFGVYVRQANSGINEFDGCTYKDSIFEKGKGNGKTSSKPTKTKREKKNRFKIKGMSQDALEEKWGIGYTEEEYYCFENKWAKLVDNYGQKTSLHREALTTYIRFRVKEELATAKGDVAEATKWGALAEKAQAAGKLNVVQLSKSDISGGIDLLPQLFEAVESKVGIIPILPKLKEQPYDDADLIIWAILEYEQRLEGKPRIEYKDIWNFYDEMLKDFYQQKGYSDEQIQQERVKRNAVFRDLSEIYKEPVYEEEDS